MEPALDCNITETRKVCTRCGQGKNLSEFVVYKRRGRNCVLAECRECKKRRDRDAVANSALRAQGIVARRVAARKAARQALAQARKERSCDGCGTNGADTHLRFFRESDGASVNRMVMNGVSITTIEGVIAGCTARCARCAGRFVYARRKMACEAAPTTDCCSGNLAV